METSELSEETGKTSTLKLALVDWEKKPKVKLSIIGVILLLLFLFFFPASLFLAPLFILFPFGFIYYLPSSAPAELGIATIVLGWIAYFLITVLILLSKNKLVVRSLFILLAILLLLNISGCGKLGEGFG